MNMNMNMNIVSGENRGKVGRSLLILKCLDYRQVGSVAVDGIGNLARIGPSAVSEIYTTTNYYLDNKIHCIENITSLC